MWRRLQKRLRICGVICALLMAPMPAWATFSIYPNATPTAGWDGTSDGGTHHHAVRTSDTVYVYETSVATDVYDLDDHAAGTELAVRVLTHAWSAQGTGELWISMNKGATQLTEQYYMPGWNETVYRSYWYTGTWTTAEVNGARVKARADGSGAQLRADFQGVEFLVC